MSQKHWDSQALPYLEQKQYDRVAKIYESLLEDDPTNLNYYWYLGLSYLLQEKEQESQLTWWTALNEQKEDEYGSALLSLEQILDQEADRQKTEENFKMAWLIRAHLREINNENITNLLNLVTLDIRINNETIENLKKWDIICLLKDRLERDVPKELLIDVLQQMLFIPEPESVLFAEVCLRYSEYSSDVINHIIAAANRAFYAFHYPDYAIQLISACIEKYPDDLRLIHYRYEFYAGSKRYNDAIKEAILFSEKSQFSSVATQFVASHQLLSAYLSSANWSTIFTLFEQHKNTLKKMLDQEDNQLEDQQKKYLPTTSQFFQYLQDTPHENRYWINQLGEFFLKVFGSKVNISSLKEIESKFEYRTINNTQKKLRIGYVGSTFHSHSVGWLSRWLINYHDKEKFEIFIYSLKSYSDLLTQEWFIKKATKFFSCDRLIAKTVQQIQEDEVDILVDLDSMSSGLSVQVLLNRPAPIQVTWLGNDASGVPAIDYFMADPYVLPKDAEEYYTEKIWRLPRTYLGIDGFEVGVPTLKREDLNMDENAIVFMNLQGGLKLHPDILRLQVKILKSVPNSFLLVKGLGDKQFKEKLFKAVCIQEAVDMERIILLDLTKTELEHRANLTIADVVLDTYPYNGATTTLETLWMEIPLVTRVGEQFAARNSYTFMVNAGITEGIARTDEDYVEWGIKLGTDENLRNAIRWKLRQSKKTSPLWNGKQFTRDMENAYRQMWEIYVQENT